MALTAVASTRSSAPTSASTSGSSLLLALARDLGQDRVDVAVQSAQVVLDRVRNDLTHWYRVIGNRRSGSTNCLNSSINYQTTQSPITD